MWVRDCVDAEAESAIKFCGLLYFAGAFFTLTEPDLAGQM